MLKGKGIIRFILALLIVLASGTGENNSTVSLCDSSTCLTGINLSGGAHKMPGNINNHSVKKEWIKIRYKGGDCKYDVIPITCSRWSCDFIDDYRAVYCNSFTSSYFPFSLCLRGPPVV